MIEPRLPAMAQWSGYLGLLPFAAAWLLAAAAPTQVVGLPPEDVLAFAERLALGWGAIILTFIAAVHWGLALAGRWDWGISTVLGAIVPSVVALAAAMVGGVQGLAILIAGFGLFWLYEHRVCADDLPSEYVNLRRVLTIGVCALLTLTALTLDMGRAA